MVPGSTLRYGSNFIRLTFKPRLSSRHPIDAAASPLPKEDTTPPVTKMFFADIASSLYFVLGKMCRWRAQSIMTEKPVEGNVEKPANLAISVRLPDVVQYSGITTLPPVYCLHRFASNSKSTSPSR